MQDNKGHLDARHQKVQLFITATASLQESKQIVVLRQTTSQQPAAGTTRDVRRCLSGSLINVIGFQNGNVWDRCLAEPEAIIVVRHEGLPNPADHFFLGRVEGERRCG